MLEFNDDIKMIDRKLYLPINIGDGYTTYVKVRPEEAIVVTFTDKNNFGSAEFIVGPKAENIAADHIAAINEEMLNDENVTIFHNPVIADKTQVVIIE
ncbi:MAG: hypothetical protein ACYSTR_02820 [Planctomycetota bacterium]|jgi:hypothetical protein